jgi:hypothetical protein
MKKILENTYCYEDFITKEQQDILYKWAFDSFSYMDFAYPCNQEKDQKTIPVRHFGPVQNLAYIPDLFWELKNRIVELEGIEEVLEAPGNGDWVGITGNNSRVEPHTDWNGRNPNYYTRRYNLLVTLPQDGGQPVYGGKVLPVKEKMLWICDAGLIKHASLPNKGDRLRVNISFGFSLKKEVKKLWK